MTLSSAFKGGLTEETTRRLSILPADFRYLLTKLMDVGAPLPEVNSPLLLGAHHVFWVGMHEYDEDDLLAILYDEDQDVFEIEASPSEVFETPAIRMVREGIAAVTDGDLEQLMEWFERRSFRYAVGSAGYIRSEPWMTRSFPGYDATWEMTGPRAAGTSGYCAPERPGGESSDRHLSIDEIDPSFWDLKPGAVLIAASGQTLQLVSTNGAVYIWRDQGPLCGVTYTEQPVGSILESRFHPLTLVEEPEEKLVEFVPDHASYVCEGQAFLLHALYKHRAWSSLAMRTSLDLGGH